jgi:hypothetical protein
MFAKCSLKQTKLNGSRFFQFQPGTQNMNFQSHVKIFSKKSQEKLKRKLAYVNPVFWSFSGLIDTNVIVENNFEKILKKTAKFSKLFILVIEFFCAFKTLRIDLVHFYDKRTAENLGITLSCVSFVPPFHIFCLNLRKKGGRKWLIFTSLV